MTELIDNHTLSVFLVVLLRIGSFFLAFPFISTPFIPPNIKILLIVALSFYLSSFVGNQINFDITTLSTVDFFLIVVKELLIGVFLALISYIYYAVVIYAAELISYLMGFTVVNMFDPTFGMVSAFGRFFVYLFYLLFFFSSGYKLFIRTMIGSFRLIPPGKLLPSDNVFEFFLSISGKLFYLSFSLAFPIVVVLFITNLILALVNRLIPQINVFIVGLPLQIFVGLLFLSVGFSFIVYYSSSLIDRMVEDMINLIGLVKGG